MQNFILSFKTALFMLYFLSMGMLFSQQDSKIRSVTVYLDGAEISRTSEIRLPSGKTELKFHNLSPYIEESSIQVSGLGDASILSISYG